MKQILFGVLCFGALSLFGQTKTYIGLQGGGNLASAYIEHTMANLYTVTDFKTGLEFGLLGKVYTKKRDALANPGLQFGLLAVNKGWAQVFPETDIPRYKVHLTYLQLPIEAIINFGRGKTKPFFSIGMYLEYLIASSTSKNVDVEAIEDARFDFYTYEPDRDNVLGYGVRVSGGLQKEFSFGLVHLDGHVTFNISNVIDYGSYKSDLPDLSNLYTIGFTVGYLIPFGKLDY